MERISKGHLFYLQLATKSPHKRLWDDIMERVQALESELDLNSCSTAYSLCDLGQLNSFELLFPLL